MVIVDNIVYYYIYTSVGRRLFIALVPSALHGSCSVGFTRHGQSLDICHHILCDLLTSLTKRRITDVVEKIGLVAVSSLIAISGFVAIACLISISVAVAGLVAIAVATAAAIAVSITIACNVSDCRAQATLFIGNRASCHCGGQDQRSEERCELHGGM
ncbi:hypothetical protein BJ166DRAFT_508406 [Pestalotiopsis sp. NC0098]|nr:hypothetical protein BJ166DRAFT_508406 [Pestalotiopsis sp. NC0098]